MYLPYRQIFLGRRTLSNTMVQSRKYRHIYFCIRIIKNCISCSSALNKQTFFLFSLYLYAEFIFINLTWIRKVIVWGSLHSLTPVFFSLIDFLKFFKIPPKSYFVYSILLPYHVKYPGTCPITEVKLRWDLSVINWETTRELT